jgi:hypothetical protein
MGRYIICLFVGNQQIGYLESWHKEKCSLTLCNNHHFARYFTTEKACATMIQKLLSSYPYMRCEVKNMWR